MKKIPFKKLIFVYLLRNMSIAEINSKLYKFGYHCSEEETSGLYSDLRYMLPESLKEKTEDMMEFRVSDEKDAEWLKHLKIFKLFNFLQNRYKKDFTKPDYFKWFEDCLWILNHEDTMSLINIFLFNNEPIESISAIIDFRYKKSITIDAINIYKEYFWDCDGMTAKEAMYFCIPFRQDTLIIKRIKYGSDVTVSSLNSTENDGSDTNFVFHDTNYIKWKIGYKEFKLPDAKDFMEQIKKDSYYKYYEVMNMTQSIEIDEEDGENDKLGAFKSIKTKKRNVEEQRIKGAKHWMEMYLKADKAIPVEDDDAEGEFFEKMKNMELDFDDEKIMDIGEDPEMLNDVREDV